MRPLTVVVHRALLSCVVFSAACDRGADAIEPTTTGASEAPVAPAGAGSETGKTFTPETSADIELSAGTEFAIKVESNPALPLVWKLEGLAEGAVVEYTTMENVDAEAGDCDGCGGFDVWHFRAKIPGEASFSLVQTHVAKPDEPALQTVPVRVRVSD